MKKVLVLKSSIKGADSHTNALIDTFLAERKAQGLEDEVISRDLASLELPVLDAELFQALRQQDAVSDRTRPGVALSDQLISELRACDLLVIGAPMYNHNVPTQLKYWFDLVARAGVTFRYTESYPLGLVADVPTVVISTRGGFHAGQQTDAVTPYLRSVLGLIGITDVSFVYGEGFDIKPHGLANGIAAAHAQLKSLASA